MNKVTENAETGVWMCSCGAKAERKDKNRFLRRHPALCTERREFTKQLAQTTRSVEYEPIDPLLEDVAERMERRAGFRSKERDGRDEIQRRVQGMVFDAIEKMLGAK